MPPITVNASTFKATCLALLDQVASNQVDVIVTKHGKAVARLVPLEPAASLVGSVTQLVDDDNLIEPIDAMWDAERS